MHITIYKIVIVVALIDLIKTTTKCSTYILLFNPRLKNMTTPKMKKLKLKSNSVLNYITLANNNLRSLIISLNKQNIFHLVWLCDFFRSFILLVKIAKFTLTKEKKQFVQTSASPPSPLFSE